VIDQPIALLCTGYGTHAVRELVVLLAHCPWVDTGPPNLAEARAFEVAESVTLETADGVVTKGKGDACIVNTPGVGLQVLFPGCPTCHEPARLLPVAAIVALAAGVPKTSGPLRRVELDLRPA
jgi:hypothetical protein